MPNPRPSTSRFFSGPTRLRPGSGWWRALWLGAAVLIGGVSAAHAGDKNGVGLQKISLPSGPGSVEGLGDSFEPQLNTGTSSYSVKITVPPGVAGLQPAVVLRYNSGGGNSAFGVAWSCSAGMSIQRQTEKGLPTYGAEDRFVLEGEELVPLSDGTYRTENESGFRRIKRDGSGWIVWDRSGTRYFLGSQPVASNPSRVVRPGGSTFDDTFKWCVDTVIDVHGNRMEFDYSQFSESPGEIYCTQIRYSIFAGHFHAVAFDFETRTDAFSSYLSGFEVRTGRRCRQIRVLSDGALVRRYGLAYTLPSDDPIEPIGVNDSGLSFSLLRKVTQFDNGATDANFLPPLRLGYTRFDGGQAVQTTLPSPSVRSLADPDLALADINADGLPDFFFTNPSNGQHQVIYNQGRSRFSAETDFAAQPTGFVLQDAGSQLLDFDGDGRIDLVQKAGGASGQFVYFANTTQPLNHDETHPTWATEKTFTPPYPPFDLNDPAVRSLDLNGDKRIDFMRTTSGGFIYYYNRGGVWEEDGIYLFGEPQMGDITYADDLQFESGGQGNVQVKLADMNGDRLPDLVRIYVFENQLHVTYWPNRGRGWWGHRVELGGTVDLGVIPIEDVFFTDMNGDGLSDIAAVGYDHVSFWVNQGNDSVSRRFEVANTPEYIKGTTVLRQADFNGNGSTDFIWENWDPNLGGYRLSYVDFTGGTKPNLLATIDNGIGLRTEISYATSTDYYTADLLGGNPWHTRLPFPVTVVAKITKRFGLDLDALPGEDKYVTEFSYFDGYYDTFEKEFRGFAFARKVERGDDRLREAGAGTALLTGTPITVNSPSTVTRFAFHTGVPDGVDNDGDNLTDERDEIGGYEEEVLKGKVLWTETTLLTAEFDEMDNDGDGFVDESDEGPGSGVPVADAVLFSRESNTWALKTIHDPTSGFTDVGGAAQPFKTLNGQKVTYAFAATTDQRAVDAVGTLNVGDSYAAGATPVVVEVQTEVDHFGNTLVKRELGVLSGGPLTYDDERTTTSKFGFNVDAWIIGLPTEVAVTDESGNFVSKTRTLYDNLAWGTIGTRGLATSEEKFIGTSTVAFPGYSPHPGDPRVGASASVVSFTQYDVYGNPTVVRDPAYAGAASGHERVYGYDSTFHTYVETETIKVGNGSADLVASASYDKGAGVITESRDFNNNATTYLYDGFFRLTGIVKPGDSVAAPTQVFSYAPGDPVRSLLYRYDASGALTLSVTGVTPVVSQVTVKSREQAGGGTFDIVQVTDGAGHKLGTIEEGESPTLWVYKNVKRYTSRGAERDSYLPFFAGSSVVGGPGFLTPPIDGARVTDFYDAAGRVVRTTNPPEASTVGARVTETRTLYLPLKTVLFDEEDTYASSPHFNTPHVQYQDGLGRLVGVDEVVKLTDAGVTGPQVAWPTRYTYDLADNLIRIVDSQNNRKWMRYDGLKRMVFMHDPDRGVMTYTYDAGSNLVATLDAKAQVIQMAYDGANRIKTEDYLDGKGFTPDVTYTYDVGVTVPAGDGTSVTSTNLAGKLSSVTDLSGGEVLSYDARGRTAWKVKRVPDPITDVLASYRTGFTYDSLDRVEQFDYPDGDHVGYGYNARNLPDHITGGPSGFIISAMSYLSSGQLATTTYGNGVATDYQYDPRLRLRTLTTVSPASTKLIDFSYGFDGASNITRIDDNRLTADVPANDPRRNTQVFGYDNLYRITSVQYPKILAGSPGSIAYSYDRIGNMLGQNSNIAATENGLPVVNLGTMGYGGSMGPTGRIGRNGNQPGPHALTAVSGGSRSYSYDANGNMESIDGLACTWDFKDRLVAVENAQMRAVYSYDYTDRRIAKKVWKKVGTTLPAGPPTSAVLYPDRSYEIREDGAPVKYVWNGETRVARVTTNLNATERVQRFRLQPGWNVCVLAVGLTNGATQFAGGLVGEIYRHDPNTGSYHAIATNEVLPVGTFLRVRATGAGEVAVRGVPSVPTEINVSAGRQWVGNSTFTPWPLGNVAPATASAWTFDSVAQGWRTQFSGSLASASDASANLAPGEGVFVVYAAPFTVSLPDPTLEIRFYHQDHLGSSSVMTDAAGVLVSETANYPFGYPRHAHEPRNVKEVYGFTQKERDEESELNYFEARFMASALARFVATDPLLEEGGEGYALSPQKLNTYVYCENNPFALIDRDGRKSVSSATCLVLYTSNVKGGREFDYAAETYARHLAETKECNVKKESVQGIESFVQTVNSAKNLKQLVLFSHSGSEDGPIFLSNDRKTVSQFGVTQRPGTIQQESGKTVTFSNLGVLQPDWSKGAEARFFGCNTADVFAPAFSSMNQGVRIFGFENSGVFSTSSNSRTGPSLFQRAYERIFKQPSSFDWGSQQNVFLVDEKQVPMKEFVTPSTKPDSK